ncbi:MAG: hypothetical protein LBJ23_02200 [Tannerella sp.]|jgi:hypothetical protein|nr:hypothetical protein [Tannerella sp.]
MKKKVFNGLKLICAACIVAIAPMLSSCLEGGGNMTSGGAIGVVRFDAKTFRNVFDISAYESFYSLTFDNSEDGTCWYIYYELDYENPENTAARIADNGYYTVTVLSKEQIIKYNVLPEADTSSVALPNEMPVIAPVAGIGGYVKGILFVEHYVKSAVDQKTDWRLSYDWEHPSVSEGGENIYEVYLRAVVLSDGAKTSEERSEICAYAMNTFLENAAQQEKSLGKDKVSLRFNYVSEIKEDGTAVWQKVDKFDLGVQVIIPESSNNTLSSTR